MAEVETREVLRELRAAAHDLRRRHLDHRFAPALVIGDLSDLPTRAVAHPIHGEEDAGLRSEIVDVLAVRALALAPRPAVLLTRSGALEPTDLDLTWLAAARAAVRGYHAEPLTTVVVTKHGWFDPFSGAQRHWKRLRVRKHWYPPDHPSRAG